jgi:sugar-specific transcriptional regulator TrmB/DNA-binding CsgD family transcriptional regulator
MLEAVGLTASDERIYRALLDHRPSTVSELVELTGLSTAQARRATTRLLEAGLISRRPGSPARFRPAPPDLAIEALILARQEELERTRLQAAELLDEFQRATRHDGDRAVVEIITGREAIMQRSVQMLVGARDEVLMFDKPPYLSSLDNPLEYEALARGVRWRALYAPESLELPERMADLRRLRQAGEQHRIAPELPLKLAITDRRLAILPLTTDRDSADRMAILVQPCSLLDTLTMLFEILWARAVPVPEDASGGRASVTDLDEDDRELLALLAAGIKDEVMARQLELSIRTVRRRIARLMHQHGASTRFQLGLVASRLGWM